MAENMTLRWSSASPSCWRVRIILEEKGLKDYQSPSSSDSSTLNPRGQLPVFTDGGTVICESLGTCMYLERLYKNQGPKLLPASPIDLGNMWERMLGCLKFRLRMADVVLYTYKYPEECRFDAVLVRNKELLAQEIIIWENYLEQRIEGGYLAGSEFSLADVAVFPCVAAAFHYGLTRERYPNITAYYSFVKNRPSIKATWPPTYSESPLTDMNYI